MRLLTRNKWLKGRRTIKLPAAPAFIFMSDSARGDIITAVKKLPIGSWVVFRHYEATKREELARAVMKLAQLRRLWLLLAGDWHLAKEVKAAGVHLPEYLWRKGRPLPKDQLLVTAACHSRLALFKAQKLGVDLAFLSPVFPTQSHVGAKTIGRIKFLLWIRGIKIPVIPLGGMKLRRQIPGIKTLATASI